MRIRDLPGTQFPLRAVDNRLPSRDGSRKIKPATASKADRCELQTAQPVPGKVTSVSAVNWPHLQQLDPLGRS